jgi:hypothetical protein
MPPGTRVVVHTASADKYGGRYDAAVLLPDGSDLTARLVDGQWAAPWNGVGAKPTPPWPRTLTP